jgi:hypothetical protein
MLYQILFPNVQKLNLSMTWQYIRLVCPPYISFLAGFFINSSPTRAYFICRLYTNWNQRQPKLVTRDLAKHGLLSFDRCNI